MANIKIISGQDFGTVVEKSNDTVLVDFYAEWCGPCKMIHPQLEMLAEKRKDIIVTKVNVDENNNLAERYKISNIPCMILFKNGEEVKRIIGYRTEQQLQTLIDEK